MKNIKVGVIGCGYWGPNLIRNFSENHLTDITHACDLDSEKLERIKLRYPSVTITANYKELLKDKNIQVVAIATPVNTHYRLAKDALEAGKHVFIEKPITSSVKDAEKLIEIAERKNLFIFVDHIFIYTGAIKRIKEFISSEGLGDIYYFDSVRVNLGLFQHDINVIWDLAPHDLSIMAHLIDKKPVALSAHGSVHFEGGYEDIAYVSIEFEDNAFIAPFHVNWLSPVKIRQTLISGDKKMLVWDDLNPDEKVKIYDRGVDVKSSNGSKNGIHELLVSYRSGGVHIPKLEGAAGLEAERPYLGGGL